MNYFQSATMYKFTMSESVQKAWENDQTNFNTGLPMKHYLESATIIIDVTHLQHEHILWAAHSLRLLVAQISILMQEM